MLQPVSFAEGASVFVDGVARVVERVAGTRDKPIIRLAGCASRADAAALGGRSLEVEASLDEGEFWAHDLVGCVVVDGGREVGVVERMVALPSCEALAVGELLIPMVGDAIRSIDVAGRRIDVDMGFVEP